MVKSLYLFGFLVFSSSFFLTGCGQFQDVSQAAQSLSSIIETIDVEELSREVSSIASELRRIEGREVYQVETSPYDMTQFYY